MCDTATCQCKLSPYGHIKTKAACDETCKPGPNWMCDHVKGRCVLHPAGCIPTHALCSEVCFGNVTAQKRKHSNNDSNTALTGAAGSGERERGAVNIVNKTAVK